ncbi:phage tail protein [Oceanobacillus kimchii]|uniref:phage tail protein n=1 Tax=Oceanobacillus kimchii TaxID=746691 RepID=UPI003B012AED
MLGIQFDDKHSHKDFGLTLAPGKEIGHPNKRKILVNVPFSNAQYDFSEIYGSQTYEPRSLTYPFNVYNTNYNTPQATNIRKTAVINWLMADGGKKRLYDDAYPGYYFLAEVVNGAAFEQQWETGVLTVEFEAYPFMISELKEGHDIWDQFNFELDVAQVVDFNVNGTTTVTLYNIGKSNPSPKILASNPMTIVKGGVTYNIPLGETQDDKFNLKAGENELTITGNGRIAFEFYKEII